MGHLAPSGIYKNGSSWRLVVNDVGHTRGLVTVRYLTLHNLQPPSAAPQPHLNHQHLDFMLISTIILIHSINTSSCEKVSKTPATMSTPGTSQFNTPRRGFVAPSSSSAQPEVFTSQMRDQQARGRDPYSDNDGLGDVNLNDRSTLLRLGTGR